MSDPPTLEDESRPTPRSVAGGTGLRAWAGFAMAVVLLAWFVWMAREDLPQAFRAMLGASPLLLVLAVGLQMLHLALRAWRWRLLLAPLKRDIGFYNLFSTTVIGYFASLVFPLRVGEIVRPLMLAGREGIRRSATIATIGVERILDGLTVLGFLATYLLFFAGNLGGEARSSKLWQQLLAKAPWVGGAMLLAIPLLFLLARYEAALFRLLRRVFRVKPGGVMDRLHGVAQTFVGGMAVLSRPGQALAALAASVAVWLAIAGATWAGVLAMRLDLPDGFPWHATLLLLAFLVIGVSVPTPGGAGGYHIIAALALEQIFGADRAGAWATAWVLWLISMMPLIALGFYFLWRSGTRVGELGRLARTEG